jgi:hypothetical protein
MAQVLAFDIPTRLRSSIRGRSAWSILIARALP